MFYFLVGAWWIMKKGPSHINMTPEQVEELLQRVHTQVLHENDYVILEDLIHAIVWMNASLQEKELTIRRLRAIFGMKTESAKNLEKKTPLHEPASTNSSPKEDNQEFTEATEDSCLADPDKESDTEPKKGHGHRPSSDFTGAKTICIAHETLKRGDVCPGCLKGKLFNLKPGTLLQIIGQPYLQVEIYKPERLRCSVCQMVFTAQLPSELMTEPRASSSAKAIVAFLKYRAGLPFYRQSQIQTVLGAPISSSEIWEMTADLADVLEPIYGEICRVASEADVLHNDDTTAQILSVDQERKEQKGTKEEDKRTGTFTTGIIAQVKKIGIKIGLFFTGRQHAGENLNDLLNNRPNNLTSPIQQCDALSRNIPKDHETILSNCNSHSRRNFYELVNLWPKEIIKIIGLYSIVFANDKSSPKDDEQRLKWHQERSTASMEEIRTYCLTLIEQKKVEPNSSFGKAIAYLIKHWSELTLFLKVPGAPLHNNDNERLIKRAVLNRKNAYFFRNENGAKIADILMTIIETAAFNQKNPYDYLEIVQHYRDDIIKNPDLWVPWAYEDRIQYLQNNKVV